MPRQWILYVNTDKGWKEESRHDDKLDAEHSLYEWLDEFPDCKFMVLEENKKVYKIRDVEDGIVYPMTLPMILEELNRDRSKEWANYDETDWREGLAEFTTYEVMEDD
tara:strand:- start:18 stop:341 length:324 start_codon:yes stop_codon:yes gene_type:complete